MRFTPLRVFLLSFLLAITLAAVTREYWLAAAGAMLVTDEGPARADAIVVLGGDFYGNRVLKACALVRAGYAPVALVSGPLLVYGMHESEPALAFAQRHGCPSGYLEAAPNQVLSTQEEAAYFVGELARRNIHSILLLTSDFHTARSGRTFRAEIRRRHADLRIRVVAAPDKYFSPGGWWHNREGRKQFFFEWSKTVATVFGL